MKKKKKNAECLYLLIPLMTALFVGIGFYVRHLKQAEDMRQAVLEAQQATLASTARTIKVTTEASEATTTEKKKQTVIDFASLQKENEDIYAWIKVPGTMVDYPVLQHPTDNEFYLHHNVDKEEDIYGSIYTENYNSLDFEDPNTILYGHNMRNGSMFGSLHRFEDKDFFDKHREILIYTEEDIIHYKIFAAFVHTNEHLFYGYDFDDETDYDRFLMDVNGHVESGAHIDRDMDVTSEDCIITLSTCNHGIATQRYLVLAVKTEVE